MDSRAISQELNAGDGSSQLWKGAVIGIAATLAAQQLWATYRDWDTEQAKQWSFDVLVNVLMRLPLIGPHISKEIDTKFTDIVAAIKKKADARFHQGEQVFSTLPDLPLTRKEVLNSFDRLQDDCPKFKVSGAVYTEFDDMTRETLETVWGKTALTNPLHPEWPVVQKMQAEIIAMSQALFSGTASGHGIITHGGTTSIIEACFAFVRDARTRRGIRHPEIVVPNTAHVAFDKAAELMGVKLIRVPVDPQTNAADVDAMRRAITARTCMIAGSAPSFPYGVIDPIAELGQLAQERNIPLHVDACLGGFVTAFAKDAGCTLPPCDFSVPGVTSISADTHKYGQAAKGTSILMFSPDSPATPTRTFLNWVGGMYVTDGIDGSRSGADVAVLWATMMLKGKATYVADTKRILALKNDLTKRIENIDGVKVAYDPQLSVVGVQPLKPDINFGLIIEHLQEHDWKINILQTSDHQVDGFHFCLTNVHTLHPEFLDEFEKALRAAVDYALQHPDQKPNGEIRNYGMLAKEPLPTFVQTRLGDAYVRCNNTIPGAPIPGIWAPPTPTDVDTDQAAARQALA